MATVPPIKRAQLALLSCAHVSRLSSPSLSLSPLSLCTRHCVPLSFSSFSVAAAEHSSSPCCSRPLVVLPLAAVHLLCGRSSRFASLFSRLCFPPFSLLRGRCAHRVPRPLVSGSSLWLTSLALISGSFLYLSSLPLVSASRLSLSSLPLDSPLLLLSSQYVSASRHCLCLFLLFPQAVIKQT